MTTMFDFTKAYKVEGHGGVAWRALNHPTEAVYGDYVEDYEWGIREEIEEIDTEQVVCHMIGDDPRSTWTFDVSDLTPLEDDDYCSSCGQIGCGWH